MVLSKAGISFSRDLSSGAMLVLGGVFNLLLLFFCFRKRMGVDTFDVCSKRWLELFRRCRIRNSHDMKALFMQFLLGGFREHWGSIGRTWGHDNSWYVDRYKLFQPSTDLDQICFCFAEFGCLRFWGCLSWNTYSHKKDEANKTMTNELQAAGKINLKRLFRNYANHLGCTKPFGESWDKLPHLPHFSEATAETFQLSSNWIPFLTNLQLVIARFFSSTVWREHDLSGFYLRRSEGTATKQNPIFWRPGCVSVFKLLGLGLVHGCEGRMFG